MKILVITGCGRSGSTLLHNLLGQIHGFAAVGEVRFVWDRGFMKNRLCGCGVTFRECAFWKAVVMRAFGGIEAVNAQKMASLFEGFPLYRFPLVAFAPMERKIVSTLSPYLERLTSLYSSIEATTSAKVIVDTSKEPHYAFLLRMLPGVELFSIHLVRDARAVAYSWQRKKRFEPQGPPEHMARQGPVISALQWMARNVGAHFLFCQGGVNHMALRYEDFIERPGESLGDILKFLGEEGLDLSIISNQRAFFARTNHSVFGNLVRFQTGEIALKVDDVWKKRMKPMDKVSVTALTWPLLFKYGYFKSFKKVSKLLTRLGCRSGV
jgi:sulfotransferase family protein